MIWKYKSKAEKKVKKDFNTLKRRLAAKESDRNAMEDQSLIQDENIAPSAEARVEEKDKSSWSCNLRSRPEKGPGLYWKESKTFSKI